MDQYDQLLVAIVGLIVSLVGVIVSYVVWRSSIRIARAEYHQSMQETWNTYNQKVLSNDANLRISEWLYSSETQPPEGEHERCKYLAFMALNAIHAAFLGMQEGIIDAKYAKANLEQLLPKLVGKPIIFKLTQECGYHPAFAEYCLEVRNRLQKSNQMQTASQGENARPTSTSRQTQPAGA